MEAAPEQNGCSTDGPGAEIVPTLCAQHCLCANRAGLRATASFAGPVAPNSLVAAVKEAEKSTRAAERMLKAGLEPIMVTCMV